MKTIRVKSMKAPKGMEVLKKEIISWGDGVKFPCNAIMTGEVNQAGDFIYKLPNDVEVSEKYLNY